MTAQRVLAVVIVVVLVGGILYFGGFLDLPGAPSANSMNLRWSAYGIDANGDRVTPSLAFVDPGGTDIVSLGAECTWSAMGESVDWNTLFIDGEFRLYLSSYRGDLTDITTEDISFRPTGETARTGAKSFSLSLETLLLGRPYTGSDSKGQYWDVKITLYMIGTVEETVSHNIIQDTLDDYVWYTVYWKDGTFTFDGGIVR